MNKLDGKQLMALWTANAPRVFAYILTLEPNWANAEDILQETSVTLWEKSTTFRPGSDFYAWACRVAYYKTLTHLRKKWPASAIDDTLLDTLSAEAQTAAQQIEPRMAALSECLSKLSARDRRILDLRYESGGTATKIAETLQFSVIAAYKALQRIHENLLACVQRSLAREGRA